MTEKAWFGKAHPLSPNAFERMAGRLGVEEAVMGAVWDVESGDRHFLSDGSLIRRFEPHHMPGSNFNWRDSLRLTSQARRRAFASAVEQDPSAACRATSWGGAQIMGFNYREAGFDSANDMVQTMADSADAQLAATVQLIESWSLSTAMRAHDWHAFAERWNGPANVARYAPKLERAYRRRAGRSSARVVKRGDRGGAVRQAQRALGVTVDGIFGEGTERAVRAFQKERGLAVDGIVGQRTWAALNVSETPKAAGFSVLGFVLEVFAQAVGAFFGRPGGAQA